MLVCLECSGSDYKTTGWTTGQGSWNDGKFFILVMSHFFLIPTLKEFKKSTNICQSYSKNTSGPVFFDSQCMLSHDSAKPDSLKLGLGVGVFPIRRDPIRRNPIRRN